MKARTAEGRRDDTYYLWPRLVQKTAEGKNLYKTSYINIKPPRGRYRNMYQACIYYEYNLLTALVYVYY